MKKLFRAVGAGIVGAGLLVGIAAPAAQAATYRTVRVYASDAQTAAHKCVSSPTGGERISLTQQRDEFGRTYYWCYIRVA